MKSSEHAFDDFNSSQSPRAPISRRKWTLTQEAFDKFLASLGEDRETAGAKYLEIRSNLVRFFQWRGSHFPEEYADETINRVAKRVSESEEIRNLPSYYLGVARMLLLEMGRERAREQQVLSEVSCSLTPSKEPDEIDEHIDCLREALQHLSPENRHLILHYYQGEKGEKIKTRKTLSQQLGIPINTLRMRALRIRDELQHYVENCSGQCKTGRAS